MAENETATLHIPKAVYEGMVQRARNGAPLEVCGLLAGSGNQVTQLYELTNADASATLFSMIPAEQFAAVKDMRTRGLRTLAIWHSHPSSPPRMSPTDLRLAFTPDVAYTIVSLLDPAQPAIAAFRVVDDEPQELAVVITDD